MRPPYPLPISLALLSIPLALVSSALTLSAHAQAVTRGWMGDAQIRAELVGVQLSGIYPSRVAWTELIKPDGTSDYREGKDSRPGRWSVNGELFCFIYALPQQGGCFRIVKHSLNCYELYTATIGGEAPTIPPPAVNMSWNGRMWREAEPATCEEKPVS